MADAKYYRERQREREREHPFYHYWSTAAMFIWEDPAPRIVKETMRILSFPVVG